MVTIVCYDVYVIELYRLLQVSGSLSQVHWLLYGYTMNIYICNIDNMCVVGRERWSNC